jgi:chemotaxis protein methyltransferase CheR
MNRTAPAGVDVAALSDVVGRRLGLHFPEEHWNDLLRGLEAAAGDLGCADMAACAEQLLSPGLTHSQVEILASHLTIGETFFFRDHGTFDVLEQSVLPDLIREREGGGRRLRIWSAGCSTGEEAYSLAICLSRLVPDPQDWDITILATDVNPHAIDRARRGIYRDWSFRNTNPEFRDAHFALTTDGQYVLLPAYRKWVTFAHLNLAEDVYPSLVNNTNAMDVVLCRNVLMYFSNDVRREVLRRLYLCLTDAGWLATSSSEAFTPLYPDFVPVSFPGITLYRKAEDRHRMPVHVNAAEDGPPTVPGPGGEGPLEIAQVLFRDGHYAEAAERTADVLVREPASGPAMELMARSCADLGRIPEALEWCGRAIEANKLNPHLYYLQAGILQELGRLDDARAALRRVIYLDPHSVLGSFSLGNIDRRQGRRCEARRHFQNALASLRTYDPTDELPDSDGMTAQRFAEILDSMKEEEAAR